MVDYDKLHITNIYNWTILSDKKKDKIYIIYCKMFKGWATFSFYKYENTLNLNGTLIYCNSFEKANKLVMNVLKVHKWEINDRYLGRYFKIKKVIK